MTPASLRRLLSIALLAVTGAACSVIIGERGSGDVITETREVSGFDGVDLAGEGRVEIEFGDTESLVIEAEDNLMPLLTSDIEGGTLVLGTTENIDPTEDVVYAVTVIGLDHIRLSGSGDILAPDAEGSSITVELTGSGSVFLTDLDLDVVEGEISGSGDIELSGVAARLDASIPGSGTLNAEALSVDQANVSISGSGDAVVNVSDRLVADIGGSGSIEYLGNPTVESNVSGSGSIESR
jgi:hypothetical protein